MYFLAAKMNDLIQTKSERHGLLGVCRIRVSVFLFLFLGKLGNPAGGSAFDPIVSSYTAEPYPYVLEQTIVTLTCEGYGGTYERAFMTDVVFYRNRTKLPSNSDCKTDGRNQRKVLSCNITITINVSHWDKFECDVKNNYGSRARKLLQFKVYDGLAATLDLHKTQAQNLRLKQTQFNCDAIGYPEPKLHWILNDSVIKDSNTSALTILRQPSTFQNKTLRVISDITIASSGTPLRVQCSASIFLDRTYSRIFYERYIRVEANNLALHMANVKWKMISTENITFGNVSAYTVFLTSQNQSQIIKRSTNMSNVRFTKLILNTTYAVKVYGSLETGDMLVSDALVFTTLTRIPKPFTIAVVNITSNTAIVKWTKIPSNKDSYGAVEGYKVVVSDSQGKEDLQFRTSSTTHSLTLKNLSPNSSYTVTVRGYNKYSDGAVSDEKSFTTLARIPKPFTIAVVNITSNTAIVKWTKIPSNKDSYGAVEGYKVVVSDSQGKEDLQFRTSSTTHSLTLKNLSPNSSYTVTVRGYNKYSDGAVSDEKSFTTLVTATPIPIPGDNESTPPTAIIVSVVGVLLLGIVAVLAAYYKFKLRRRKMKKTPNVRSQELQIKNQNNPFDINLRILYPEHYEPDDTLFEEKWEISRNRLNVRGRTLGGGYFGVVKLGYYTQTMYDVDENETIPVAVKTLKNNIGSNIWPELLREFEALKHVNNKAGHQNVVGLIGACTEIAPILIVLEYCSKGNLKDFLNNSRVDVSEIQSEYRNIFSTLTERQLINFAAEIAQGMEFLFEQKIIHRDIASRNIFLDEKLTPKIGDFGLARKIDINAHYIVNKNKMLPVKWMALESLQDGRFTTASDIWSYGVLLWEICTLGEEPYSEVSPYDILDYLREGRRMTQPVHCSVEIFSLMERCWDTVPINRPNFTLIYTSLLEMLADNQRIYVNVTTDHDGFPENLPPSFAQYNQGEDSDEDCSINPLKSESRNDSGIFDTSL